MLNNLPLDSIGKPYTGRCDEAHFDDFKGVDRRVIVADALLEKILLLTTL